MKKISFLVLIALFVSLSSAQAFDIDLYGRIGALKMTHPDFEDEKWGVGLDIGGTLGISDFFALDVMAGYGYVQVKPPEINGTEVSWQYLKTVPFVVSVVFTPLNFLPIINPYLIAGLGTWRIMDPNKEAFQGFGGSAGFGVMLKGGCFGFDLRVLYEKPDFDSAYKDLYISIAPVLYLGF